MSASTVILVLSVDEAPLLEYCLPAALAQPDARVVVVDNACTDGTAALCERLGVKVVPTDARLSYAAAMNVGFRAVGVGGRGAAEDLPFAVLLLNADCVIDEGFLAAALPRLQQPEIGSVAPKLIRATGPRVEDRLDVLDTAAMVMDRRRKNGLVGHGEPATSYATPGEVFGGDGACVLYRREVLDACAIDGEVLDEDMALWASDVDLAWRAQVLGWRAFYEPAAVGWHQRFYSPTTRASVSEAHRRLQFRNRYLMMLKNDTWRGLLRDLPWVLSYEVLALGHVLLRERHLLSGYREVWTLRRGSSRRRGAAGTGPARRPPPFATRAAA